LWFICVSQLGHRRKLWQETHRKCTLKRIFFIQRLHWLEISVKAMNSLPLSFIASESVFFIFFSFVCVYFSADILGYAGFFIGGLVLYMSSVELNLSNFAIVEVTLWVLVIGFIGVVVSISSKSSRNSESEKLSSSLVSSFMLNY